MEDTPKLRRPWIRWLLLGFGTPVVLLLATLRVTPKHEPLLLAVYDNKVLTSITTIKPDGSHLTAAEHSIPPWHLEIDPLYFFSVIGSDVWNLTITHHGKPHSITLFHRGKNSLIFTAGEREYFIIEQVPDAAVDWEIKAQTHIFPM